MTANKKSTAKDRLESAFFELLEEKHYSKIAVSELIEKAGVSRTTFYRHYVDIFDMYKKVCEHLLEEFFKIVFEVSIETKEVNALYLFDWFCEMLKTQQKYIVLLCGTNGDRYFFERIFSMICENIDKASLNFKQEEFFKLKFILYAGIGSYIKSLIDNTSIGPEILTLSRMILNFAELSEAKSNG